MDFPDTELDFVQTGKRKRYMNVIWGVGGINRW